MSNQNKFVEKMWKKMFNLDEEKIVFFLAEQDRWECCVSISDVGVSGIYMSLTLGTAKFKPIY